MKKTSKDFKDWKEYFIYQKKLNELKKVNEKLGTWQKMGHNKDQYEHLQKWKKERRKLKVGNTNIEIMYVDTKTGEILTGKTKYKKNERNSKSNWNENQKRLWD